MEREKSFSFFIQQEVIVIFDKFNKEKYKFLNLSKYGSGKGVKVATLESVGVNSLLPYKIVSDKAKGSSHGKNTALTCLEVAPQIELHSISNLNDNIDFVISEGIKVVFASIGEITLTENTLKKVRDNNIILIKSSGNVDGMSPSNATKSGDWITISSVGLNSSGNIYHSSFSEVHDYIDFASFGYVVLPDVPDMDFPKYFVGTSFSCPLIAGVAALILEDANNKGYELDQEIIYSILKDNSYMHGLDEKEVGNGVVKLPDKIDYEKYAKDVVGVDFIDIDESRWSYDHIKKLVDKGIMNGYPDKTFRPSGDLTREEFAAAISKVLDVLEVK